MTTTPVITFLSDYGLADDFVSICHGVIAMVCPQARVIDLSHGVPRHDVRAGALLLRNALPYTPSGVHVAVVDPDVGAQRRALALAAADGRMFVGPDNGLLWPAVEACGGAAEAVEIEHSPFRLEPVSATFHGRDIFAPVAARLADGAPLADAGVPCDPAGIVVLELPRPQIGTRGLIAHVVYVDRFGNAQLDAVHEDVSEAGLKLGRAVVLGLHGGRVQRALFARTFAELGAGELLVYEDAHRSLAIAISNGDAAARLGLAIGDEVRIIQS